MRKIEIFHHYDFDPDGNCSGDYRKVSVKIDGEVVAEFGDYYHDKGHFRAESFVDGVLFGCKMYGEMFEYSFQRVADYK